MNNVRRIMPRGFPETTPTPTNGAVQIQARTQPLLVPTAEPGTGPTGPEIDADADFVGRHERLRSLCMRTFADYYAGYSDPSAVLLLTDAEGRLVCYHAPPSTLAEAMTGAGWKTGAILNESSCGSNIVMLALQHRQALISSCPDLAPAPFGSRAMLAVPLLKTDDSLAGCVAVFNTSENALGEKLLLTKLIARKVVRVETVFPGKPFDDPTPHIAPARPEPLSPTGPAFRERRRGDRRRRSQGSTTNVKLTRRQVEVLKLFAQGKGYKEIARDIGITSYKTVEEHLDAVRHKLDVTHRRECIQKAMALGLI